MADAPEQPDGADLREGPRDWREWHRLYDGDTALRRRLGIVQQRIREHLDRAPLGAVRALSMCAGEGRDLLGALADHPRRADVRARLVELDPENAARARAAAAGFSAIEVVEGDASTTTAYAGAVPVDLALVCGVFGNISQEDIARTVAALPTLCAPGGTVVWTRHRRAPDRTPWIRELFAGAGFLEIAFDAPDDTWFGVGTHRLSGAPAPFEPGFRMFTFARRSPSDRRRP